MVNESNTFIGTDIAVNMSEFFAARIKEGFLIISI
jgi:hypothetical protein